MTEINETWMRAHIGKWVKFRNGERGYILSEIPLEVFGIPLERPFVVLNAQGNVGSRDRAGIGSTWIETERWDIIGEWYPPPPSLESKKDDWALIGEAIEMSEKAGIGPPFTMQAKISNRPWEITIEPAAIREKHPRQEVFTQKKQPLPIAEQWVDVCYIDKGCDSYFEIRGPNISKNSQENRSPRCIATVTLSRWRKVELGMEELYEGDGL